MGVFVLAVPVPQLYDDAINAGFEYDAEYDGDCEDPDVFTDPPPTTTEQIGGLLPGGVGGDITDGYECEDEGPVDNIGNYDDYITKEEPVNDLLDNILDDTEDDSPLDYGTGQVDPDSFLDTTEEEGADGDCESEDDNGAANVDDDIVIVNPPVVDPPVVDPCANGACDVKEEEVDEYDCEAEPAGDMADMKEYEDIFEAANLPAKLLDETVFIDSPVDGTDEECEEY